MAASGSDEAGSHAAEIQRVREALAAAEAALDSLITDLTTNGSASPDSDNHSDEAATKRTEERAAALTDDIDRLRRQVEQFKDRA